MRLLKLFALFATLTTAAAAGAAQADVGPPWGPETPNFNLEVVLRPAAGGPDNGFGLVKFRQPNDENKIILLDVWVRNLLPNHTYNLQRAVDMDAPDGVCSSETWLTLGPITTDGKRPRRDDRVLMERRERARDGVVDDLLPEPGHE